MLPGCYFELLGFYFELPGCLFCGARLPSSGHQVACFVLPGCLLDELPALGTAVDAAGRDVFSAGQCQGPQSLSHPALERAGQDTGPYNMS